MARVTRIAFGIVMCLATLPAAASTQQTCDQVLRSDFRRVVTDAGQEIMYYRNPVRMVCTDGLQIEADSAVMNRSANTVELVGRVLYRDGDRQLTSDWARYVGDTDQLFARGSVVLTDNVDGSIIRGEEFEFQRETLERPRSRMIVWGGRPHAELRRAPADGADAARATHVRAARLELLGETVFLAQTAVEIEREDLRGAADTARFDQAADRMTLTGSAHVETDAYRLDGDRIDAHMAGDALREVLAEGTARLVGEDLTVSGRNIRIGFVDGDPERIEAWSPPPVPSDQDGDATARAVERAVANSRDFRLRADSIDARSIDGRLREVYAVGRAYGESEADTLSVRLPDPLARDWIQGDTIIGYFADATATAPDPGPVDPDSAADRGDSPGAGDLVLERVEVIGGTSDALSLYRTDGPDGDPRPAFNFTVAKRITLFMRDGEVDRVEADGPIEGIYLDPARGGTRPRAAAGPAAPTATGTSRP